MFDFCALHKGENPKTISSQHDTGIHGVKIMKQVLIILITFHEFLTTRHVPGPVRATRFHNLDPAYL
jgi:hypothetical protein